jgi:glycosyltransferase involved in cell wall biosynthesis
LKRRGHIRYPYEITIFPLPQKDRGFSLKLAVIIPAFNEEDSISSVILSVRRSIGMAMPTEIVVVDDGSTDSTSFRARHAGADYIVRHSIRSGVGQAVKTGIQKALAVGADIIVNIDADGQFDAKEISSLIGPIVAGKAGLVLGSRFKDGAVDRIPIFKRIGNIATSGVVSILVGKRLLDTQCGFRAFSREAAQRMHLSGVFTYTQEMVLNSAFRGTKMMEVPVSVRYFKNRKSRVVKSIFSYALKAFGVIIISILRQLKRWIALVLLVDIIIVSMLSIWLM